MQEEQARLIVRHMTVDRRHLDADVLRPDGSPIEADHAAFGVVAGGQLWTSA